MIEILYCPITNEIFLFSGLFELDEKKKVMTIYVYGRNKYKIIKVNAKSLTHLGWL
jgi:hypothetical protein